MANYLKIISKHPETIDCFFAFSNQQFAEGIKKHKLEGKKLFSGGAGLYGTKEGIRNFFAKYDDRTDEVTKNCSPQEVYDYEFENHECSYTNDDEKPIKLVINYFGAELAKTVKRQNNCAIFEIVE